jgi:transmembrane sensor
MDEDRIIYLLTRKIANEANPEELKELSALLQKNPDAIYYEEILKSLWLPHEDKKSSQEYLDNQYQKHKLKYADQLHFDLEPEIVPDVSKKSRIYYFWLILLPVMLIAGLYLGDMAHTSARINYTTIIAGKGIRKEFELPDGTKVWLNSESKLSYDAGMSTREQRVVQLVGEAFFDVAHDKSHPFVVNTDKIAIKVLGTAFNVEAYPNEEKSTTTLIRGSIELSVKNQTHPKVILKPSEKFDLIDHKARTNKSNPTKSLEDITLKLDNITPYKIGGAEYIAETSWKENRLIFQNERFEELIPKLERWFNVRINVNNQNAMNYRFTGIFTSEKIDEALNAMRNIKQFNFKIENNDINIY